MDAAKNKDLKYPVGMLYQPVSVGYKTKGKNRFKMSGFIINNPDIISMMDNTLTAGKSSDFLPVSLKNDGTTWKRDTVVSDTAFLAFEKYAEKLSEQAIGEILDGNVAPSPLKEACGYCDYKDMCPYEGDERFVRDGFPKISSPEDLMTLANGGKIESRIEKETNEDD